MPNTANWDAFFLASIRERSLQSNKRDEIAGGGRRRRMCRSLTYNIHMQTHLDQCARSVSRVCVAAARRHVYARVLRGGRRRHRHLGLAPRRLEPARSAPTCARCRPNAVWIYCLSFGNPLRTLARSPAKKQTSRPARRADGVGPWSDSRGLFELAGTSLPGSRARA